MENRVANKRNIQPFNGERYGVWKFRVKSLLTELNIIKVIESEIPCDPSDEWHKNNNTAKSVIIDYLGDSFLGFAKGPTSAREIFQKLDEIYERKSLATQLALRKRLLTLKLQGDISLLQHFTNFDDIITELIAAGAKLDEMDRVSHLLLTLPSCYDGVITALETLSENNLNLSFVKTRLLDHEVKLKQDKDTSLKVLHVGTHFPATEGKPKMQFKKKKHFGKPGHQHQNKSTQQVSQYKTTNIQCDHCGRRNHIKKNCRFFKRNFEKQRAEQRTLQTVHPVPSTNPPDGFAFMIASKQVVAQQSSNTITFLLDSGASDHIVNSRDLFTNIQKLDVPIKLAIAKHDTTVTAYEKGTINVESNLGVPGSLENVLYIPDAVYNILSVRRIQACGMTVVFDQDGTKILHGNNMVATGKPFNGLIGITFKIIKICSSKIERQINMVNTKHYQLWHERLGHVSNQSFLKIKQHQMVEDVNHIDNLSPANHTCEACIYGKQTRLPFSKTKSKIHVQRPLFIIHSDVCGPISPITIDDKNYFVTFVDEFTHYTVTYLIKYKSEVLSVFKDFIAKGEAHFNCKVVYLYTDNGGEYLSNDFKEFCVQKGITFHLTVPHTPQQNGVAERMNRTLTEKARTMIITSGLDKSFWGEAVLTATYLINILPTSSLQINKTPYEMWHNKKPQLKFLKVFGSTVYIHNKTKKSKFDEKSFKGILVGYNPNGYKVWNVNTKSFLTARDVIVDETNFKATRPTIVDDILVPNSNHKNSKKSYVPCEQGESSKSSPHLPESNSDLRRSERVKNHPMPTYKEDLDENINNDIYSHLLFAKSLSNTIPNSFDEIKVMDDRDQWELAIKDEIDSLLLNKTWSIVDKPTNKNIVGCKWVFTTKIDEHGNPVRHKARLVAKGFSQQYLSDYNETFAPVARISTFRFLLAFSNQYNLLVHQMDVKTAFLNGVLKEEVFMKLPEGIKADANKVCKLNKALYGLKQASRCWYEKFDNTMKELSFESSSVDPCMYFLNKGDINKNIYVILYVDDLLISTKDLSTMSNFKSYLMSNFHMKDLNEVRLFLGIRVQRSKDTITLDQTNYLKSVLNKFNMAECKPVSTPLENKLNYVELNTDQSNSNLPCRNLIGCLMYAMLCTRPDLCITISILSRFQSKSNEELWKCLKRVLRYIQGSIDLKLTFKRKNFINMLEGFVDSDWANNEIDRRSTTGYLFRVFENCTISWNSKRQTSVAASSTEAEYMALFECVREAIWLRNLLESLSLIIPKPIPIFEDNNGCICIANNPTNHKRTKHIDIKYHFTREQITQHKISVQYIPTGEQLADAFTKPLPAVKFINIRNCIGLE